MSGEHFVKLYGSIVHSSIWRSPDHVRLVWITMLAMADADGFVGASVGGLADAARVTVDDCKEALAVLAGPDEDSRDGTTGERIEKVDRGWLILNAREYRERQSPKQVADAARQKRKRERDASRMSRDVTVTSTRVAPEVEVEVEEELKSTRAKRPRRLGGNPEATAIFDHWVSVMGKQPTTTKLTAERIRVINARLGDGYTVEQLKAAVDGCKQSSWHMGDNPEGAKHNELVTILRDDSKVDRHLDRTGSAAPGDPLETKRQALREQANAARNNGDNAAARDCDRQLAALNGVRVAEERIAS